MPYHRLSPHSPNDVKCFSRRFSYNNQHVMSARNREPAAPRRIYKPRLGLNDISVLPKSCHGRNLGLAEPVIWRMSVKNIFVL
jgi:hypothetical protein